jgi:predicted dehydrogenase
MALGLLYDLAERVAEEGTYDPNAETVASPAKRPTPDLDVQKQIHTHAHPGESGIPTSYSEALAHHPSVLLVACADPTAVRQNAFTARYPGTVAYDDAEAMLKAERPDIVAIATNTNGRAALTALAVKYGAKAIFTDKPMAHTLAEVDLMVQTCAAAGVPLNCGAISRGR